MCNAEIWYLRYVAAVTGKIGFLISFTNCNATVTPNSCSYAIIFSLIKVNMDLDLFVTFHSAGCTGFQYHNHGTGNDSIQSIKR